jgi:hypothetical protein
MTRPSIVAVASALILLTFSACGSDADSGSDSGSDSNTELSEAQSAAAKSAVESAAADGITLDEECVEGIAGQLSEDDARLAADDADAELSAAGEALGLELLSCADADEIVELFIAGMSEGGEAFDEDCAREQLQDVDVKEIIATAGSDEDLPAELVTALTPCFGG